MAPPLQNGSVGPEILLISDNNFSFDLDFGKN